jgi:pSer/pThr/pTyr-binding forkhead associated (FHA) protein
MRLEVLIGSDEPIIFPLNSSRVVVGSSEGCDIILNSSGVSRKHVIITSEDDMFYVTDQGSTNGTFVNEERLIPGRRTEFTSFFPVRLGDNVLLSLLSEEEEPVGDEEESLDKGLNLEAPIKAPAPESRPQPVNRSSAPVGESTTVINLKELQKARTENLVKVRDKKREIRKTAKKTKPAPKKTNKKTNYVPYFALLLVGAAAYYNFYMQEKPEEPVVVQSPEEIINQPIPQEPVVVEEKPKFTVPESELPARETLGPLLSDIKCATDTEKFFCDRLPGLNEGQYGAVQVGTTIYLLMNFAPFLEEASSIVMKPVQTAPEIVEHYEDFLRQTAVYLFFTNHLKELDEALLGDLKVVLVFFNEVDGSTVDTAVAFYPKSINANREKFNDAQVKVLRRVGVNGLSFTKDIYTLF